MAMARQSMLRQTRLAQRVQQPLHLAESRRIEGRREGHTNSFQAAEGGVLSQRVDPLVRLFQRTKPHCSDCTDHVHLPV